MPSLGVDLILFNHETDKLRDLVVSLSVLPAKYQKLVAEIVLLRLFSMFENSISSICYKISCGIPYTDGQSPILLTQAVNSNHARTLLQVYNRRSARQLHWSKASEIRKNIKYVVDSSDPFYAVLNQYESSIEEIRRVRNRVAHNNAYSRRLYREVVRNHYGAYINTVTPGTLLLTSRWTPRLLDKYISESRILVKDLVRD